jgi:hypothetical protein
VIAGWSIDLFFTAFRRMRGYFRLVEVSSGGLLVAVGLLVATNRLAMLNDYFVFLSEVVTRAEEALL